MIFYMHDAETFSNDLFYNISKCIFETEDFFFLNNSILSVFLDSELLK